jgi:isopenicillin N synthase-like dioxygenase
LIGVDQSIVDNVFSRAKKFFDEPVDVKMEIDISQNEHRRGYIPLYRGSVNELRKGISPFSIFGECTEL